MQSKEYNKASRDYQHPALSIFCPKSIKISKKKVFTLNLSLISRISDLKRGAWHNALPLNMLLHLISVSGFQSFLFRNPISNPR